MKKWELYISAKFEKGLKTKNLHTKYIKSVYVIMHKFERLNEVMGYSGYTLSL